jgi:hypothetical protein
MPHTIWHDDTLLGTVDLPRGQFVASRLQLATGYHSVAEIVQRSTGAFLRPGLFYSTGSSRPTPLLETREWFEAIEQASQLRLALADSEGQVVATHFINLLGSVGDDGVVLLVSLEERTPGRPATKSPRAPTPTASAAPAV